MEPARPGEVDQRPRRTRTGTTCRTCCRSTRRCTGRTRPAARRAATRDPTFTQTPGPYTGPVPIVTHVHGAVGVGDESDGYAEAWYLPTASNIPAAYASERHLVRLLRSQGRPLATASGGDPASPSSSTRTTSGRRRSGTTTTPSDDPPQRLRGPGRLLPDPWRPDATDRARLPAAVARAAGPAPRRATVPARQDLLRDPDRDPGPLVQRRWLALLSRTPASSSTGSCSGSVHPGRERHSRRSGIPSSSVTRWWSTAGHGRSSRSSSAATASAS